MDYDPTLELEFRGWFRREVEPITAQSVAEETRDILNGLAEEVKEWRESWSLEESAGSGNVLDEPENVSLRQSDAIGGMRALTVACLVAFGVFALVSGWAIWMWLK